MPKTVEDSLLGDHSDQWIDSDCPEAKRLKVSYTAFFCNYTFSNFYKHCHNIVFVHFVTTFQSNLIEFSHSVTSG